MLKTGGYLTASDPEELDLTNIGTIDGNQFLLVTVMAFSLRLAGRGLGNRSVGTTETQTPDLGAAAQGRMLLLTHQRDTPQYGHGI